MTEEISATPGWVDERLDELFRALPDNPDIGAARAAYAECLGRRKSPAAISDQLGAEFTGCSSALLRQLSACRVELDKVAFARDLEALEAEIDTDS